MTSLWNSTIQQLLTETKGTHAKDFLKLDYMTSIDVALSKLKESHERSAAVYNNIEDPKSFIGSVDVFDIIFYLLALYKKDTKVLFFYDSNSDSNRSTQISDNLMLNLGVLISRH